MSSSITGLYRGKAFWLAIFLAVYLASFFAMPASAQGVPHTPTAPGAAIAPSNLWPLTGTERLGRKWMDEQRIDNCNVPIDKRGSKPRASACDYVPSGWLG
jgi:hypothetical protein